MTEPTLTKQEEQCRAKAEEAKATACSASSEAYDLLVERCSWYAGALRDYGDPNEDATKDAKAWLAAMEAAEKGGSHD